MTSPFTTAVVRCRQPHGCPVAQLLPADTSSLDVRLAGIGWSRHADHGWLCPQHGTDPPGADSPLLSPRALLLLTAIRDGHDFGLAIMRETGLSESTVYAALRRLRAAGRVVCAVAPADLTLRRQRPRRKIYRLTPALLDELGWADGPRGD